MLYAERSPRPHRLRRVSRAAFKFLFFTAALTVSPEESFIHAPPPDTLVPPTSLTTPPESFTTLWQYTTPQDGSPVEPLEDTVVSTTPTTVSTSESPTTAQEEVPPPSTTEQAGVDPHDYDHVKSYFLARFDAWLATRGLPPVEELLAGWSINILPGRAGLLGITYINGEIDVFMREGLPVDTMYGTFAHEIGHGLDITTLTPREREQWGGARQFPSGTVWFPVNDATATAVGDRNTGTGDWAESITSCSGNDNRGPFESHVQPIPPTDAQCALAVALIGS